MKFISTKHLMQQIVKALYIFFTKIIYVCVNENEQKSYFAVFWIPVADPKKSSTVALQPTFVPFALQTGVGLKTPKLQKIVPNIQPREGPHPYLYEDPPMNSGHFIYTSNPGPRS